MALSRKDIQSVNALDFDTIKNDFVTFLTAQDTFKDYNFEGSGMSVLLDILAYNTHHMAFYANMLANESFLDSCLLRGSAVSLAKSTGYTPRSRRGAEIVVDVRMIDSSKDQANKDAIFTAVKARKYRVLKNELFSCNFGGTLYYFYATDTVYFSHEGTNSDGDNLYYARNVLLREGRLRTKTFTVNNQFGDDQRFIIPDINLDDRSVNVFVRKSINESESSTLSWMKSGSILDNDGNSRVFFLQEAYDGKYEVYFGDGIIGKTVDQGNIILVTYASCSGILGNGIGISDSESSPTFRYLDNLEGEDTEDLSFSVNIKKDSNGNPIPSYGGQEKESIASIKLYSPRLYESQDRAVTLNDYVALLQSTNSGSIRSINAWGGEDNDPPEYGKVLISVRPTSGLFLSTLEKLSIENGILSEKNIVTITPRVVDPEYLFLSPTLDVKYDPRLTTKSVSSLQSIVLNYVRNFGLENLSAFEKNFFSGQMIRNIILLDSAIKSCTINLTFNKILYPTFETKVSYSLNFENELSEITSGNYIYSSSFLTYGKSANSNDLPSVRAYFKDNGRGKITLYQQSDDSLIKDNFGSVDHLTGSIKINDVEFLLPSDLQKYDVNVYARPKDDDVLSKRNTILEMNEEDITVNMTPITTVRL